MGTKAIGTVQAIESGIFRANFSGNNVANHERVKATSKDDNNQPYQYIAGPSSIVDADQPSVIFDVAG